MPVMVADKGRLLFSTSPVVAVRRVGCRAARAAGAVGVVTIRGGVRPAARVERLAVSVLARVARVLFKATARAAGARATARRSGLPIVPAVGRRLAVSTSRRAGGVRVRMPGRALQISASRAAGRVARLLEAWDTLPAPWASVVVPQVGFVGRSLAALEYLRGEALAWDSASGAVSVGGQVVVGDDGGTVRAASVEGAAAVIARQCETLAVVVGVAIAHRGEARQAKADLLRKSARIAVGKAARALARGGIEANRARALQAELLWRESRI